MNRADLHTLIVRSTRSSMASSDRGLSNAGVHRPERLSKCLSAQAAGACHQISVYIALDIRDGTIGSTSCWLERDAWCASSGRRWEAAETEPSDRAARGCHAPTERPLVVERRRVRTTSILMRPHSAGGRTEGGTGASRDAQPRRRHAIAQHAAPRADGTNRWLRESGRGTAPVSHLRLTGERCCDRGSEGYGLRLRRRMRFATAAKPEPKSTIDAGSGATCGVVSIFNWSSLNESFVSPNFPPSSSAVALPLTRSTQRDVPPPSFDSAAPNPRPGSPLVRSSFSRSPGSTKLPVQ